MDREAPPPRADVEDAIAVGELELAADEVELLLLGLLEGVGAAREDRAAVGHRAIEEEREELVRDVVVMANRARVALLRMKPPARRELGDRGPRRQGEPRPARRRQHQASLGIAVDLGRVPARYDGQRRVEVVGQQVPAHVRPADSELPRSAQQRRDRLRRANREDGPVAVGRRDPGSVPELDRERPLREVALDLTAQRLGAREWHRSRAYCGCGCYGPSGLEPWTGT